ncbi:hypothetical protein QR680_003581 [Steinernema hermaphroditum]|uniref:Uncharacterized protein n=1 Tax=Steinernema hermaphroditum TaxID=289476 RepID=A0AA39HKV8_9BILA|nr:hypothetical protein QR680_003581 [Steinernema hermaphroditum]
MDTVSLWFRRDVTAYLGKADLVNIFELDDLGWQAMAGEHIPDNVLRFNLDVIAKKRNFSTFTYRSSASVEEIQKSMFRVCTDLFIKSGMADSEKCGKEKNLKNVIRKIIVVDYAEKMEMHDVVNFDSCFPNFWPRFVSCLIIRKCTFASNSTFSFWMSRILRTRCLEHLEICNVSLKKAGEDFEDEILDSLLDDSPLIDVKISGNKKFLNLSPEFLDRLVLAWSEREAGFQKSVDVNLALDRYEFRAVRKKYFKHNRSISNMHTRNIDFWISSTEAEEE